MTEDIRKTPEATGEERSETVTLTRVKKDYGLTDLLVRKLLPEPTLVPNPMYRNGAPMKLWDKKEVERILATEEAQQLIRQSAERRKTARKGVETKRKRLEREVDEAITRISVKRIPCEKVLERAIKDKEEWNYWHERWDEDSPRFAPVETQTRWCVNYIRHKLTKYDRELWDMRGKVGILEQYVRYKLAVLDAIGETYPEYQTECENQKNRVRHDCGILLSMHDEKRRSRNDDAEGNVEAGENQSHERAGQGTAQPAESSIG